jgi:small subunit ribosomal protein S16
MLKIRLKRIGARQRPFYRVVVADSRKAPTGRFVDQVGTYDPTREPSEVKLDLDRVREWMGKGAQPTATVKKLIRIEEKRTGGDEPGA